MTERAPGPETSPDRAPGGLLTAAFVLAGSAIAGPVLVLLLTQAVLRQLNPRGLDLADPASYQVELWLPVAIAGIATTLAIGVVFSRLARADRGALRYPVLIVQLQVGFAIAAVALLLLTPGLVF